MLDIKTLKTDLSIRCKNGIPFIFSEIIVWIMILSIYISPFNLRLKNLIVFFSMFALFPLSVLFTWLFKSEWSPEDNELSSILKVLNISRFISYPIVVWAFIRKPEEMVLLYALIVSAHLFPYGWLYDNKAFTILSPIMTFTLAIMGWLLDINMLWCISLSMLVFLIILNLWVYREYDKKINMDNKISA